MLVSSFCWGFAYAGAVSLNNAHHDTHEASLPMISSPELVNTPHYGVPLPLMRNHQFY
ncbi:hypothetical protein V8C43DRAFT_283964 [Trichoderma afarasin]